MRQTLLRGLGCRRLLGGVLAVHRLSTAHLVTPSLSSALLSLCCSLPHRSSAISTHSASYR